MAYKHKTKPLDTMLSRDHLGMAAACHFNDLVTHLNYFHSSDDEYFGNIAEALNKLMVIGLAARFRSESEFERRVRDYLEITATDEMIGMILDVFRVVPAEGSVQ